MNLGSFAEIGVLLGVATVISLIMRFLKQPLIIGHIITGIIMSKYAINIFHNKETLELFSQLGIAFLLFTVGLTLSPKILKQYGFVSVLNTAGQVFLAGGLGTLLCVFLGYTWTTALYVGIATAFSSTVIVFKLLADKGDLDKLYVKVSIGSLLLQDLIAIILLFAIPIVSGSDGLNSKLFTTFGLALLAGVGVFMFANHVIRYLHSYLSSSQELLFIFANAWAIGVAILFQSIGLSLEGGALIAGVALSNLPSSHEIGARLAPLKDFFIVSFFILLGTNLVVSDLHGVIVPALILSVFVLLINPLIQLIVMGILGYRKKTSFQAGMMAAQISEFSLILVGLGVSLKQVPDSVLSTITLVGIVTIFISTYLILYSERLYNILSPILGIFEKKNIREKSLKTEKFPIILIGAGRVSYDFLKLFKREKLKFLVLDHDPDVIKKLSQEEIKCEYGDVSDPDFLEDMKLSQADFVISTAPDLITNHIVISVAKKGKKSPVVWVVSHRISNALELYGAGADYVIMPHFLGGKYASSLLKLYNNGKVQFNNIKKKHILQLNERIVEGHEHPQIDRLR